MHEVENSSQATRKHALAIYRDDVARHHANQVFSLESREDGTGIAENDGQARTLKHNIESCELGTNLPLRLLGALGEDEVVAHVAEAEYEVLGGVASRSTEVHVRPAE